MPERRLPAPNNPNPPVFVKGVDRKADLTTDEMSGENIQLSGYEQIRQLGKGAYGVVVLCRRSKDDVMVAVKRVNVLNMSSHERQMALNETNVLATLHHPNIIEYFDSFEKNGSLLIAMEYADGGNVQEYLSRLEIPMPERKVLTFLDQVSSALSHMHEKHILHRDLKTANIFLTQNDVIKLGDFGISKVVDSQLIEKNTIVGTPYYISPEMCDGKQYDEKSDIWSFGCVAYEMACLHKTFEGTNLPALVHKIVNGQFAPIRGDYSNDFRQLIRDMLQKEPLFRPSANDIFNNKIPNLIKMCEDDGKGQQQPGHGVTRKRRSVLMKIEFDSGSINLLPVPLPPQHTIRQLTISSSHTLALTTDGQVFVWGDNSKGQLGLEDSVTYVERPRPVHTFKGKNVNKIGCGDRFSIFVCTNGILMTCGDGSKGCLGHDDWKDQFKPKILEKLLCLEVSNVSCGPQHVVVIGGEKWAFSWGQGSAGRLGQGDEENKCSPLEITFPETVSGLRDVRCGSDGTVFLVAGGRHTYACGSNANNKLSLDVAANIWTWRKAIVDKSLTPKKIRSMSSAVIDVSLGLRHSAFLLASGEVVTVGSNNFGQLGRGHQNESREVKVVDNMEDRVVNMVSCGPTFTLAATTDNALWFWGIPRAPVKRVRSIPGYQYQQDQFVWGVNPHESTDYEHSKAGKKSHFSCGRKQSSEVNTVSSCVDKKNSIVDCAMEDNLFLHPREILAYVGE